MQCVGPARDVPRIESRRTAFRAKRRAKSGDVRLERVDLRKLSEWIKTTQQVKTLREEDLPPELKGSNKD